MNDFCKKVADFLYKEKGLRIEELSYMELPKERERYNFRGMPAYYKSFMTKEEANLITQNFLSMKLPG